jgi:hypothetical protein
VQIYLQQTATPRSTPSGVTQDRSVAQVGTQSAHDEMAVRHSDRRLGARGQAAWVGVVEAQIAQFWSVAGEDRRPLLRKSLLALQTVL